MRQIGIMIGCVFAAGIAGSMVKLIVDWYSVARGRREQLRREQDAVDAGFHRVANKVEARILSHEVVSFNRSKP